MHARFCVKCYGPIREVHTYKQKCEEKTRDMPPVKHLQGLVRFSLTDLYVIQCWMVRITSKRESFIRFRILVNLPELEKHAGAQK